MANNDYSSKYTLLRGGSKIDVYKKTDIISVRTKRGAKSDMLTRSLDCQVSGHLYQQNLTLMSVNPEKTDQTLSEMRANNEVSFASNVFSIDQDPEGDIFLTDEITVQFEPGTDEATINTLADQFLLNYVKQVTGASDCHVFRINDINGKDAIEVTNGMMAEPAIKWCEPNIVVKSVQFFIPSDPLFESQWHLFNEGGIQLEEGSHVDAPKAWDITKGDRSIVVAVADDSVDLSHRDLQGVGKIVAPRDFQGRDFDPNPERDEENHGTSVAGVAVAEENGFGSIGVAPGCALMPIRTSGFLDDNSIEDLFGWVRENGAAVMCNSWGPAAINFPLSLRQSNAISRCAREGRNGRGVMIFFAAGNSNRPIDGIVNETGWPGNQLEGPVQWKDGFATHPDVIAVSASTSLGRKSAYSSWGNEISVCAPSNNGHPGIGVSPTYPRIFGPLPGRGIFTTDRVGPAGYDSSDFTDNFGGTSSACPLATGVGALILSANPNLTAKEARSILESSTDKIIDNSVDPQLGNAFGTYDANGHSQWFGFGKVNAFKAVLAATEQGGNTGNTNSFTVSSSPNLAIPDANETGIVDQIQVDSSGVITRLNVSLDITHTYVGDLEVSLIAPSGKSLLLHNRSGGSTNNINQEYNLENTPILSQFIGEIVQGGWQLRVVDRARMDTGVLNKWELKFEVNQVEVLQVDEAPGVVIPDADPSGITRTLNFATPGTISQLKVEVDISHTYISDLVLTLTAPSGKSILLHNRAGGSSDNITTTYSFENLSALVDLRGESAVGDWALTLQDLAARDTGKLNFWRLEFELDVPVV